MNEVEQSEQTELNQIVAKYLEVRGKREALLRDYEAIDAALKEELKQFEVELLDACSTIGANSINTPQGTVVKKLNERYYCTDWDNFYRFIAEQDMPQLLEKRIHQGNFKEFYQHNSGDGLPPGVNVLREFNITVRKPSK